MDLAERDVRCCVPNDAGAFRPKIYCCCFFSFAFGKLDVAQEHFRYL